MSNWDERYMKVNGVRVSREGYAKKLRKIHRLAGKRVLVQLRHHRVVHAATLTLVEPTGRQVYPRLIPKTDCGLVAAPSEQTYYGIVTCRRCR